jgi:hypothetical protein
MAPAVAQIENRLRWCTTSIRYYCGACDKEWEATALWVPEILAL